MVVPSLVITTAKTFKLEFAMCLNIAVNTNGPQLIETACLTQVHLNYFKRFLDQLLTR